MSRLLRWLIGCLVYLGILSLGHYALGIHWTFAELLLITFATAFSIGVQEGLE